MEWWHYVLGVVGVLMAIGFREHVKEYRYGKRYVGQTYQRRQVIRKLCAADDDWEHMALVLKHGGFNDEVGKEISVDQIKAEYAAMVLMDIDEPVVN